MEFDLSHLQSGDSAAPPPALDVEFDSPEFNLCYPFPQLLDSELLGVKPEDDISLDNPGFMFMPEFFPPDITPTEIPLYVSRPFEFFYGTQSKEEPQSLEPEKPEPKNEVKMLRYNPFPVVKQVGTCTLEERRFKIYRYLEKRRRRSFKKKVDYVCRKKVADNRIRIKGRFVSK